jgi:hypothetical protein
MARTGLAQNLIKDSSTHHKLFRQNLIQFRAELQFINDLDHAGLEIARRQFVAWVLIQSSIELFYDLGLLEVCALGVSEELIHFALGIIFLLYYLHEAVQTFVGQELGLPCSSPV